MTIAGHEGDVILADVKEHTVHHRTELIVSRSKQGSRQTVQQNRAVDADGLYVVGNVQRKWILIGVLAHETALTILVEDFDFVSLVVHLNRNGLLVKLFQTIQDGVGFHGKFATSFRFLHVDGAHKRGLAV